jgi:uncharacterized protein
MKIGLLSDTHSYFDINILEHFKDVDEIWHAGDIGNLDVTKKLAAFKPLRAIIGNIDGSDAKVHFPEDLWWDCEGMNIWMTHIGGYPTKYASRVRNILKVRTPDLFICGHSHILRVMKDPKYNMMVMNPGAAGIEGFHQIRTMLRFEIKDKIILNLEAIELGTRKIIS